MPETLLVQIPGDVDPMDRYDLYERPLNKALRAAGRLGSVAGGGTGMSLSLRGVDVRTCYLDLDVKNLPKAVPAIRDALVRAQVPPGTLVGHCESDSILLHFTRSGPVAVTPVDRPLVPPAARVPWSPGEVVGYRLTPERWVLLHVAKVEWWGVSLRVPEWCGAELPAAGDIPDVVRRPPTKYALSNPFFFPAARIGAFEVRLNPPRMLSLRRTARTGVTVKGRRSHRVGGTTDPGYFDKTLTEVFGLTPVDGATRLYNDLGIGPMHLHFAAWDAGTAAVTPAAARRLFYAHVSSNPVTDQPLRGTVPPTEKTRLFVDALKAHFRGSDVWGWGSFRAKEGFVIIPVDGERFADVWPVAARLAKEQEIALYDPQAHRVARPTPARPRAAARRT